MPDQYAHYIFARRVYDALDPAFRARINPESMAFRVGSFGPDPLFNEINAQRRGEGFAMHHHSGAEAMNRMRAAIKRRMPYAAEYAAGFFCHYALDRLCHPNILMRVNRGDANHVAIETAYDRELMARDAAVVPRRLFLTNAMCAAAAEMYHTAGPEDFRRAVMNFWRIRRMLYFGSGTPIADIAGALHPQLNGLIPRRDPNTELRAAFAALDRIMADGVAVAAQQLMNYFIAVDNDQALDPWLNPDFLGKVPEEAMRTGT